ncbi:phage tail assembly chaperone protein [Caudoviricetes sp.]|nr:phage tail assembly chaperone protein [Caudoviricetes sp.]UOF81482.1 phage tail assembly chaperone protein [Caudoviricetes sp.]
MKIGLGHLRMRPDDFWKMSLPEFFAAIDGYLEAKGANKEAGTAPPSAEEVEEMFAALNANGDI